MNLFLDEERKHLHRIGFQLALDVLVTENIQQILKK